MIISIRLKNFRRFRDESVEFTPGINFIEGVNNAGKTTIFYAIEYALFGRVAGFRSPAELIFPGQRTVGAEIIFRGRDGRKYKLQRIHTKPPRARTKVIGHYTLKAILEDTQPDQNGEIGEKYLLSSDFQDREETLSLRLYDILGISRKLFEVAICLRQGEISSILEGAPQLDIVLGITASVLASDEMRAMALEMEKESADIQMFRESARRLEDEKKVQDRRKKELENEIKAISEKIRSLDYIHEWEREMDQIYRPVNDALSKSDRTISMLENISNDITRSASQLDQTTDQHGRPQDIKKARSEIEEKERLLTAEKEELDRERSSIRAEQRETDRRYGDLKGRIARRQSLPTDKQARCETCGQIIDHDLNRHEIEKWRKELERLETEQQALQKASDKKNARVREIDEALRTAALTGRELSHAENTLQELALSLSRYQDQAKALSEESEQRIRDIGRQVRDCKARLAAFVEKNGIDPGTLVFELDDSIIRNMGTADRSYPLFIEQYKEMRNTLNSSLRSLEDGLKALIVSSKTELRQITGTSRRMEQDLKILSDRMANIDREYAIVQEKIGKMGMKQLTAQKLRRLSAGFKALQVRLREKASRVLEENTYDLHKVLSAPDKEYKAISIDPAHYAVRVTPYDINREVSAHLYQGGGHKLLLGLAFKLATARLAGPCPFVLLDEPTYGLDEIHRNSLLERINRLNVTGQMLLITHHDTGNVPGRHIRIIRKGKSSVQERG